MRRSSLSLRQELALSRPVLVRPVLRLLRPFDPEQTLSQPPPSVRETGHEDLLIRLQQYRIRNAVTAKTSGWEGKVHTSKLSAMLEYDRSRVATVNLVALRKAIVVDQKKRPGKRPFVPRYVEESKLPPLFNVG